MSEIAAPTKPVAKPTLIMPEGVMANRTDNRAYPEEGAPGMPKIGEKCLIEAVYGRMINPNQPAAEFHLDKGRITKVTFDEWHTIQWKAGKIKRAEG